MAEIQVQESVDPWAQFVALVDLAALKQTGTVSGFKEQFDLLYHQTKLTEKQAASFFVNGLKDEIQPSVRLFKPQSLYDAYCLAFLQESCLEDVQGIANTLKPILEPEEIPRAVDEIAQVVEAQQEKTTAGERDKLAAMELDQNPPLVTPIADDDFPISCEVAKDEPANESTGMVQNQPPALEIAHATEGESTLLSQGDQVVGVEETFGELNSSTHKLFDEMPVLSGLETTSISRSVTVGFRKFKGVGVDFGELWYGCKQLVLIKDSMAAKRRQYTDRLKSRGRVKVNENFDATLVMLERKGMADEYLEPLALLFPKPGPSISLSLAGIKTFVKCDGGSLTRSEGKIDLLGMEVTLNADKKSSKEGSVHGHLVQDNVLVEGNWKVIIQILKLDSIITGNQNLESWSSLEMNPLSLISKHLAWVPHENRNVDFWNVESISKTTGNGLYLYCLYVGPNSRILMKPYTMSEVPSSCYVVIRFLDVNEKIYGMCLSFSFKMTCIWKLHIVTLYTDFLFFPSGNYGMALGNDVIQDFDTLIMEFANGQKYFTKSFPCENLRGFGSLEHDVANGRFFNCPSMCEFIWWLEYKLFHNDIQLLPEDRPSMLLHGHVEDLSWVMPIKSVRVMCWGQEEAVNLDIIALLQKFIESFGQTEISGKKTLAFLTQLTAIILTERSAISSPMTTVVLHRKMVDRGRRAKLKSVPVVNHLLANSTWNDFHILLLQFMKFRTWSNDSSNYGNATWVLSFDLQQLFPTFPNETYVESLKLDVVHGSTLNCFYMCQESLWWLEGKPFFTVILVLLVDDGSLMLDVETLRNASWNSKVLQMRFYFGRATKEAYKLVLLYLLLLGFQLKIRLSFHAPFYLAAPMGLACTCLLELTIILHRKMVDRGKGLIRQPSA